MNLTKHLKSPLAAYGRAIRETPRNIICNRTLLLSALVYSLGGIPGTWDQGASSTISSLPSFQEHFGVSSGAKADEIRDLVSLVYIGQAIGAALSFFVNDRLGRRWSYRLYILVWIIGQLVAIFTPGLAGLYASRIICGSGIGSLSVIGPMSLVEISPGEIRGLLTAWFVVFMGLGLFCGTFTVYACYSQLPPIRLQYQTVWFVPCIVMVLAAGATFFLYESPKWLMMQDRHDEAIEALCAFRDLPPDHDRIQNEIRDIRADIAKSRGESGGSSSVLSVLKELFTVGSNLRRLQQTLVAYALAQMSGANSVTSYFMPIMSILGISGGVKRSMFLSGMYGFAKLAFSLLASCFFIDTLGRRKSLIIGISCQMLSHTYLGVFIKYHQQGPVSEGASEAALAAVFIHAFGYAVGLLLLSYVFGGELWPNRLRSLGSAISQTFHWIFIYAIKFSVPSILKSMDQWGAFIFFAGWCFLRLLYVFFVVPETSNMSTEEINAVFEGPLFTAYRRTKNNTILTAYQQSKVSSGDTKSSFTNRH
ncbi:general substrate transporter [Dactylonectria macrodidyma]|uniref:General substrate transporter n=1 Tax=Dactylonectria macrodidyma TaxID=307937 RepID=A0A9P9INE0_9HYPO|nr:general substrate transporter [Dactylonectria macrodidyma]